MAKMPKRPSPFRPRHVRSRVQDTVFGNPTPESMYSSNSGQHVQDTIPSASLEPADKNNVVLGAHDTTAKTSPNQTKSNLRVLGLVAIVALAVVTTYNRYVDQKEEQVRQQSIIRSAVVEASRERNLELSFNASPDTPQFELGKKTSLDIYSSKIVFGDSNQCLDYPKITVELDKDPKDNSIDVDLTYSIQPKPNVNSKIPVAIQNLDPIEITSEDDMRDEPYFAGCFPKTGRTQE